MNEADGAVDMYRQLNKADREKNLLRSAILSLCIPGLFLVNACRKETPAEAKTETTTPTENVTEPARVVLRSSLAGSWYPADAEALGGQIEGFFQKAQVKPIENVIALILPHAGYRDYGAQNYQQKIQTNRYYWPESPCPDGRDAERAESDAL